MITIKAKIKLFKGDNKRKTPFGTGYRPLFEFISENRTSGQISLLNKEQFEPGEEGIVKIVFLNERFLGEDFSVGESFRFYEAKELLGNGKVIEILERC